MARTELAVKKDPQLSLFGAASDRIDPLITPRALAVSETLPPHIRLGTSTWTFPGWNGIVYAGAPSQAALVKGGLEAYARHPLLRTVGIDRSYYGPLTIDDLEGYAAQLPKGWLAISKVWEEITTYAFPLHPRFGDRAGQRNPHFLDPETTIRDVLEPYEAAFADHAGPFVFELAPSPLIPDPEPFARAIDHLLSIIAPRFPQFRFAFELRTRDLLTPRYVATLRAHRAAHVLNFWSQMPTIGEQLTMPGILDAPFAVARLMLPPGVRYDEQKAAFAPFNRIQAPQASMRADVVRMVLESSAFGPKDVFVLVNNKAEGCAPLTVYALSEAIGRALMTP